MQKQEVFNISLLFIFSFSVNYYYGSLGVLPIDSFAFFDTANIINKGFLPIRDYWTSNGFFVDILQSFFFKFFGVSWFSYLLHSSLINFVFAYLTYRFLIFEGLSSKSSLFYSISVAILAYPSAGVPFSDHHSLIFSLISIYILIYLLKKRSTTYLFVLVLLLFLSFLSKQIPAGFFSILIFLYLLLFSIKQKNFLLLKKTLIYILILISFFLIFLIISKIGINNFLIQYIFFPLTIGSERTLSFELLSLSKSIFGEYKFFLLAILLLIYQFIYLKNKKNLNTFNTGIIFLFVILIAIVNQQIMKNQNIIFFLLPILFGIIHSQISLKNKTNKNIFLLAIIFLNIFITFKYHERFNLDRKFMDLQDVNKSKYIPGENISSKLRGLKWITKTSKINLKDETNLIKSTIHYLKNNKDQSIIITEYQFINSEINHNIYSPNRWYTKDGVSYPLEKNKYRDYYINFYKQKLLNKNVKKIFTVSPLDQNSFDFVLRKNCYKTTQINQILFEHDLLNCFAK